MIAILLVSNLSGGNLRLSKSQPSLTEFYYSCFDGKPAESGTLSDSSTLFAASIYRDAIQYELAGDTIWVKVFITTDTLSMRSALETFKELRIRAISQFGNIFAAKINLLDLPALDGLAFIRRIEPVVPDRVAARASTSNSALPPTVKKK